MQLTKYRAQILLEQEQHQVLVQVAERENRSLSDLVREIVREWLDQHEDREIWEQRSNSIDRLATIRKRIQEQHGIYTGDLIEESRSEREDDTDRTWRGEP